MPISFQAKPVGKPLVSGPLHQESKLFQSSWGEGLKLGSPSTPCPLAEEGQALGHFIAMFPMGYSGGKSRIP